MFGNGYKYKLNYYRQNDRFGGGLGRVEGSNDLHVEVTSRDMNLLAMRTDQNNKIECLIDKVASGSVPGTLTDSYKNSLDGYILYKGSFPAGASWKSFI